MSRKRSDPQKRRKKETAPPPQGAAVPASEAQPERASTPRRGAWALAIAAAAIVGVAGIGFWLWSGGATTQYDTGAETWSFVGSETCAGCHETQAGLWHPSQHAHAMDHATEKTVLGDFNDASFDYFGVRSRFFREGGKFFVETDGPDGKLAPFEVKYTFGLDPLQQYLVAFPDGRIQALPLAWDSRPKDKGGQRWFHLYPHEEIKSGDVLHWTKLNQNWNFMCAECHSTGVRKNYDAKANSFHTTWSEISVGCEACHGQGSKHVAWAQAKDSWWPSAKSDDPDKGLRVMFHERRGLSWTRNLKTGQPERSAAPASLRKEVETCGLCHARRGLVSEDWVPGRPLSDTHMVALLAEGVYQPDGQMLDEVYNYGSFKQSKMFEAGVTCSDCHDPHSAKLKLAGDKLCLQCHAESYATPVHTHHEGVTPGVTCVACHMPARTYMVVDERHDHSFRVPRPDLSPSLGTSNACNDCHKDKSPEWAAAAIEGWFGPERKGLQIYGKAFHAGWNDSAGAAQLLAAVASGEHAPAFARASALTALASYLSPATLSVARHALADKDPMVRLGVLDMLEAVPPRELWPVVSPLLTDPVRSVRIRAALLLAGMPSDGLSDDDRKKLDSATTEFIAAQELNADRPESRTMLGGFYARRGAVDQAEAEYKAALRLSPAYGPAAANLADLYRGLSRDADAEAVLRQGLAASPRDPGLHHALGLTLVRLKRQDEALAELAKATELEPGRTRYAYVYAVALEGNGKRDEALAVLKDNLAKHAEDRDTLGALVQYSRDAGDTTSALQYAERLLKLEPDNAEVRSMVQQLRQPSAPGPQ